MADGQSSTPTSQAMQQTNTKSNQDEEDKRRAERKKTIRLVAWVCGSVGLLCFCIGWLFYWLTRNKVINTCKRVKDASKKITDLDVYPAAITDVDIMKTKIKDMSLKKLSLVLAFCPPFGLYNIKHYLDAHNLGKAMDKLEKAISIDK